MSEYLLEADKAILMTFNGSHTPWLDSVMMTITGKWIWVPLYILLAALIFRRHGWRMAIVYLLGIAVVITLTDQVCASLIRPAVERLRPCNALAGVQTVNGYCPGSFSFPSCHGANTFALATYLAFVLRNRGVTIALFVWAAVVSISRLYLGVHYPSDILAGAIIGSAIAASVYWLVSKIRCGKKAIAVGLLLAFGSCAEAQTFEWGGEFATIFDNREGNAHHTPAETYFLTRLAPEIGISFQKGRHRIMGGAVWTQPIGCEWDGHRVSPTLYYQYRGKGISGSFGMFPRSHLIRPLPEYLVSDSTRYFQNNLRGALLQAFGRRGFFELLLDWRGMQTDTRREAFSVTAQGEWKRKRQIFFAGATAMLNHLAKVKNAPADQYVVDNLTWNPYAGLDFMTLLRCQPNWHVLSLRVGALGSLTRDRGDHNWLSATGVRAELDATFWRITLRNVTWLGNKPLFPLYGRYGSQLSEGEPYFGSKWYNRTELSALLVRYKDIVNLRAELDFHLADRNDFMFYQRLILTVKI